MVDRSLRIESLDLFRKRKFLHKRWTLNLVLGFYSLFDALVAYLSNETGISRFALNPVQNKFSIYRLTQSVARQQGMTFKVGFYIRKSIYIDCWDDKLPFLFFSFPFFMDLKYFEKSAKKMSNTYCGTLSTSWHWLYFSILICFWDNKFFVNASKMVIFPISLGEGGGRMVLLS